MKCPKSDCSYDTANEIENAKDISNHVKLLEVHCTYAHPAGVQDGGGTGQVSSRTARIQQPKIIVTDGTVLEEDWEFFLHSWSEYKTLASPGTQVKEILGNVLGEIAAGVFSRLGKAGYASLTEADLLVHAKKLVVKERNLLVNRLKLATIIQDEDEPVYKFETRLKPIARTGKFQQKCEKCNIEVDFTEQMVRDHLIRGLSDLEIKKKVLALEWKQCTLEKVLAFVEAEELGKRSISDTKMLGDANAISGYKKQNGAVPEQTNSKKVCWKCGGSFPHSTECPKKNESCDYCGKSNHVQKFCKKFKKENKSKGDLNDGKAEAIQVVGMCGSVFTVCHRGGKTEKARLPVVTSKKRLIRHMRYDGALKSYVVKEGSGKNLLKVVLQLDDEHLVDLRSRLNIKDQQKITSADVSEWAIADTGATVCCGGVPLLRKLGLNISQLLPTALELRAANGIALTVIGVIPILISSAHNDELQVRELLYIVKELRSTFISRDALIDLGSIPKTFPLPGTTAEIASMEGMSEDESDVAECGCLRRTVAPDPPVLDFPATEENRDKMKNLLLKHYASSTFNTCQHQPLPLMHGPPLELHTDPNVKPQTIYTPASVPVHWKEQVEKDIRRDVALGVLEEVPENTPVTWCHRLVVCRKHNGEPRRTVDLQKLNDASIRQCHPTEPPLQQAMTVPHNMKKTTLDAWNGYHSVAIREEDRHKTTFITEWGRFRYKTAPQGYLASGDGYTHRYDKVTMGFGDVKRVVDDSLLFKQDLETSFQHTAKYLTLTGKNGIIQNPAKFRFAEDEVEWAGIKLTRDGAAPMDSHVQAIRDFPAPLNVTDMRSFWALVNQVAPYYAVQPHLLPFRELMKKNSKWYWDEPLQLLFEQTKTVIADAVIEGITRYDKSRWTALLTDWSRSGIGFTMSQKYCQCTEINPICCVGGWKTCMVGSNFLSPAEAKYYPIEGECLGVVNALYKTRYYTQGCDKLIVGTDHKPLVPILSDRDLESITNPRLQRLKEKTLGWRFRIMHIPGRLLGGTDALSRHLVTGEDDQGHAGAQEDGVGRIYHQDDQDTCHTLGETCKEIRGMVLANIRETADCSMTKPDLRLDCGEYLLASLEFGVRSITWEMVKKELVKDPAFQGLAAWINGGCLDARKVLPEEIKKYWRF